MFTFERIAEDQTRTRFAVKTDLALTRRYDIRLQELPLLCREILERCDEDEKARTFTYTEAEMVLHASGVRVGARGAQEKESVHKVSRQAGRSRLAHAADVTRLFDCDVPASDVIAKSKSRHWQGSTHECIEERPSGS